MSFFFFGWLFNFYITKVQDNLDMSKFLELKDVNCCLSYFRVERIVCTYCMTT